MWIKVININGEITSFSWIENYDKLRNAVNITFPGFLVHEAVQWSDFYKKWFFLPRFASNVSPKDVKGENYGTNLLLIADENFTKIEANF
uniref:Uncharacterized protein n=1 Tax=Meloidogyne enterolobii TaxID=390850 RepID=A0A6V7VE81_MELEN|nr:unnamed protein product [Meloidogyne enterolobii]